MTIPSGGQGTLNSEHLMETGNIFQLNESVCRCNDNYTDHIRMLLFILITYMQLIWIWKCEMWRIRLYFEGVFLLFFNLINNLIILFLLVFCVRWYIKTKKKLQWETKNKVNIERKTKEKYNFWECFGTEHEYWSSDVCYIEDETLCPLKSHRNKIGIWVSLFKFQCRILIWGHYNWCLSLVFAPDLIWTL